MTTKAQQFLRKNTQHAPVSGRPWRYFPDDIFGGVGVAREAGAVSPSQNIWQFSDGSEIEFTFGLVKVR